VTKEHAFFGRFFSGSKPSRVEREEVLQYLTHRINENVPPMTCSKRRTCNATACRSS
jgi:hypothetical protein